MSSGTSASAAPTPRSATMNPSVARRAGGDGKAEEDAHGGQVGGGGGGGALANWSHPALKDECIPLIDEALAQHRDDALVADRALAMLCRLTPRASARTMIADCYGVKAVVDVMRIHSLRLRIQTQACLVLENLAYRNSANKERVRRAGGYQAMVAAMSMHRSACTRGAAWRCVTFRTQRRARPSRAPTARSPRARWTCW